MRWFRLTPILLVVVMILVAALVALVKPSAAQQATVFPLAEPGPYAVGYRLMDFVDASRDGRTVEAAVWYPAIQPQNPDKKQMALFPPDKWGWLNAKADLKGAPYPLILYSPNRFGTNLELKDVPLNLPLASHGFVVVGLRHPHDESQMSLVNRPVDVLFVIDQLAAITTGDLAGLIDTNHIGVMGGDYGPIVTVTGARIDPAYVKAWLSKPAVRGDLTDPRNAFKDWNWDELAAYRAKLSPVKSDELWPPFTDQRIKGVLMIAPCYAPMFGDQGLAAATVPSFIIAATADIVCPYDRNAAYAYAHLGSQDRYLLSVVNGAHLLVQSPNGPYLAQFTMSFFGYYLQGHQDYAQYLTAKYVDSVEAQLKLGLVWGPYTK